MSAGSSDVRLDCGPRERERGARLVQVVGGEARDEAFEVTRKLRAMEAALDPEGLSTTARAVLARIRAAR